MSGVAVILPVHNEEWLIGSVLGQVTDFARSHQDWRFVFIDDGSSDDTPGLIQRHIDQTGPGVNIELMRQIPNAGKASAVRTAVLAAREEIVCFTDGDLAYPLEHLDTLVEAIEDADVVIGSRALASGPQRNITRTRRLVGTSFNMIVRIITGLPYKDTQAGLKGFRSEASELLFREQKITDFAFDAEILFLAKRFRMHVKEIPANVSQRHSYKKSRVNMLRDPLRMLSSLIRMRILHRGIRDRIPAYEPHRSRMEMMQGIIEPNMAARTSDEAHATSET